jgi:hypothetical protein
MKRKKIIQISKILLDIIFLIPIILISIISRVSRKNFDIGLGPEPLINNIYHKKALELYGYKVETFVNSVYYITDQFDIRSDKFLKGPLKIFRSYYLFLFSIFRYKCLYFYFTGGALGFNPILWIIEPFLYRIASVKTVLMPYGGDVQVMSRSPNLLFKDTLSKDYPIHKFRRESIEKKIDLWTKYADHIISGCEWVDYMYHWNTLMLGHFSIDTEKWKSASSNKSNTIKILHAPNHRNIKGTEFFIKAVEELKSENYPVELILLEKVSNDKIKEVMETVDIVADQLIIGWYAMFALEAMSMEKPVLGYIRKDLESLYICSGLIEPEELPLIKCSPLTIKEDIKAVISNRDNIYKIGKISREFVIKHHSIEYVGKVFDSINKSIGILPKNNFN